MELHEENMRAIAARLRNIGQQKSLLWRVCRASPRTVISGMYFSQQDFSSSLEREKGELRRMLRREMVEVYRIYKDRSADKGKGKGDPGAAEASRRKLRELEMLSLA